MSTAAAPSLFRRLERRPFYPFTMARVVPEAVNPEHRGKYVVISKPPIHSMADSTMVPFYFPDAAFAERVCAVLNQCWTLVPSCLAQDVINFVLGLPVAGSLGVMYDTLKAIEAQPLALMRLYDLAPDLADRIREAVKLAQAEDLRPL